MAEENMNQETAETEKRNIKKEFLEGIKEEYKILNTEENKDVKFDFKELYEDNLNKFSEEEQKELSEFVKSHGDGNIEKGIEELEKMLKTEIAIENGAPWEYDFNNNKVLKISEPYTKEDKEKAKKNMSETYSNQKSKTLDPTKEPIRIQDREGREYTLKIIQTEKTPKSPAHKELHIILDETGETLAQLPYANDFFDKPTEKEFKDTILKEFKDHKDEMIDNYRNYQEKKHLEDKEKEHEILMAEKEFTEDREKRINDAFGKNPTETDRNKKTEATTSKKSKESLELGKTYLATFSWTDKNGEKQEIKACFEIGKNKKDKEAIIFKNNKTFPYSDTSLAPGDENIQKNIKAAKISQFPKDILSSPKLLEVWNKRLEHLGLEKFPEGTKDLKVETKDITRELEKEEKKELSKTNSKIKTKKTDEEAYEKPVIKEIPEKLKQFYESKGNPLTEEKYTKKLFNMTKELFTLPEAEKNIADFDKKFFKNLNKEYSKTDGSKEQLEKTFDKYILNPKNEKDIKGMGITLEKHETMEQPLKRQIPDEVRYDMNMALDAIKKNKHPLQQAGIPPLIFNPEEKKAYRGNAQLSLATNNLLSGTDEKAYVTMSQANQAGAQALKNYKASTLLVAHGQDSRGNYVYQLMVPCKSLAARNADKKLAQIEKDNRKINYEMVKAANKFYKKHGFLPQYDIELVNKPQEALASIKDISIPKENGETVKERITNDLNKYMAAAITQTEYKPSVDYTKEPHKTELFEFQQSNPGMMIMLANKAYYNIANQTVQAKTQERTNENTNVQNQSNDRTQKQENINTQAKGRRR